MKSVAKIVRAANKLRAKADDLRHNDHQDERVDRLMEWNRELLRSAAGHKTESVQVNLWLRGKDCEIDEELE